MVTTRSSPCKISGDGKLSRSQRIAWTLLNMFEQFRPQSQLRNVVVFPTDAQPFPAVHLPAAASPTRILSNKFWLSEQTRRIAARLGDVHVTDIGCGSGGYAKLFEDVFSMRSYLGLDLNPRPTWVETPTRRFVAMPAEQISADILGRTNLVTSQSALEHFPEDLTFARKAGAWARSASWPIVQMHLLPGPWGWRQTGPHGFRGYPANGLRKLIDAFAPDDYRVVALGGPACNRVHFQWVYDKLRPGSRDRRGESGYVPALSQALEEDLARRAVPVGDACFIALVLGYRAALDV